MAVLTMLAHTAHHGVQQTCTGAAGRCQGRKIPCLTCTRPDAEPWPPEHDDTFTPAERMAVPLCVAACIGLALGFVYGIARHFNPAWFN